MPGFNYRLTDLQAAVGRAQLARLDDALTARKRLVRAYGERLAALPGPTLPSEPSWARSNWQSFCVLLPEGADQRRVMQAMLDDGVATRRGVMCAHREPAYANGARISGTLTRSEAAQDRGLILPLFGGMGEADIERVAGSLGRALRG